MTDFNLIPLVPELFIAMIAMGLLIVGVLRGNDSTDVICWASVIGLVITIVLLISMGWERSVVLNGMFVMDKFAGFMKFLILIGLIASISMAVRFLYQEQIVRFEYPILILLAGLGMLLMVSANNFLSLYMSLELQSLSLYVLAAFRRNTTRSAEAGAKYFILGALSSGMVLFGISFIYGFTGSLDYGVIGDTLPLMEGGQQKIGVIVGMVFLLAGLAFKISAVPFHMWTPDVYHGAPTSVTALFAIVPKIAALGMLVRILFDPFASFMPEWTQIIVVLACASMFVGAFAALRQDNFKRLMAYSSIGNMGYALVGVAAGSALGIESLALYLMIYMVMTVGVFAVMLCLRRDNIAVERISGLAGISRNNPGLAYTLAILLFSMSGIPPMAGFFGKFFIFQAAIDAEMYFVAIFGVLMSVVSAFYYLRIIKVMFFDAPVDNIDKNIPFARRAIMLACILFIFGFTVKPNVFVETTQGLSQAFFLESLK